MSCHPSIFASFWLVLFAICFSPAVPTLASAPPDAKLSDAFKAMLTMADPAQRELQNGRLAAYKALWSHADDITL